MLKALYQSIKAYVFPCHNVKTLARYKIHLYLRNSMHNVSLCQHSIKSLKRSMTVKHWRKDMLRHDVCKFCLQHVDKDGLILITE